MSFGDLESALPLCALKLLLPFLYFNEAPSDAFAARLPAGAEQSTERGDRAKECWCPGDGRGSSRVDAAPGEEEYCGCASSLPSSSILAFLTSYLPGAWLLDRPKRTAFDPSLCSPFSPRLLPPQLQSTRSRRMQHSLIHYSRLLLPPLLQDLGA